MNILADENLDALIIEWLRESGHDVEWAVELTPGEEDERPAELARAEDRVLITRDRDFGELAFRGDVPLPGVVLLRLPGTSTDERLTAFQDVWPSVEQQALSHFVVVSPGRIRVRPL